MRRLSLRRWTTFAVALATCVLPLGSAQAAAPTDNVATAVIQQDEGRAFDLAWDVSKRRGDADVLDLNSATARARCVHCRATAIAFQITIVVGSPTTVAPVNYADAANVECTACQVAAEARQFVRVVPDPVRLTGAGRAVLADVREELAGLEETDLPVDQLHQAVEVQEARVRTVLQDDLVLESSPQTSAHVLESVTLQDSKAG